MVKIGHWTSADAKTGCTVVLFESGAVASGEVRGGAPATREFAMLDPTKLVQEIDAVVLTGGSAFGLAAADGVVSWLSEQNRGYPTRSGPVPIVIASALFDLAEGVTPPGPAEGRAAVVAAADRWDTGRLGAGAGATLAKLRGATHHKPGGIGYAVMRSEAIEVHALIAVNSVGEIDDGSLAQQVIAGDFVLPEADAEPFENTTIGVIWTNAKLDKVECRLVAESGHNGLARALLPAHTRGDGDALVAVSVDGIEAPLPTVRLLTTIATEQAIRSLA